MTQPLNQPGTIHAKILRVMSEVGSITKDRKNQQQGYSFRGIDDIYNTFYPLFVRHGVFCVPKILEKSREERTAKSGGALICTIVTMEYSFFADDGSSVTITVIGEGMDSGDKSASKAMSMAQKYAFFQMFLIPTEESIDAEKDSPQPAPRPAPKSPEKINDVAPRPAPLGQHREVLQRGPVETEKPKATDLGELLVPFGAERVRIRTLSPDALRKKIAWAKDKPHYKEFVEKAERYLKTADGLESQFGERTPVSEQRAPERRAG